MTHYHQRFTVHPVGQGLFYSGVVGIVHNANHQDWFKNHSCKPCFKMVFDCGSVQESNAHEEAAAFREKYLPIASQDRLDLLVISHFDEDHVNKIGVLLEGGRKVNRLVMPFTSFAERLFLVLRSVGNNRGVGSDDYYVRFALDPLNTLGNNLDGDSEIYFMESDPNNPPFGERGSDNTENRNNFEEQGEVNYTFSFEGQSQPLSTNDRQVLQIPHANINASKIADSAPGTLTTGRYSLLMEFLFYKKSVSSNDALFFNKVYELFLLEHRLDNNSSIDEIIEHVKTITSSKPVKHLFEQAYIAIHGAKVKKTGYVTDLNHTALCMLHRNLGVLSLANWTDSSHDVYTAGDIATIKKPDGTKFTETKDNNWHRYWYNRWHIGYREWIERHGAKFPNVLLTSDSFLKSHDDADAFYQRYHMLWHKYWLFQVPHHGSENNADQYLFGKLSCPVSKLINHGIKGKHPSRQVIQDLVNAGQGYWIEYVNECYGLEFVYEVSVR